MARGAILSNPGRFGVQPAVGVLAHRQIHHKVAAKACGVSVAYMSRVLTGHNRAGVRIQRALSVFLGRSANRLFTAESRSHYIPGQ